MISFPGCKINIGLKILQKRIDGFHELQTVFYPIGWRDVLEILPNKLNSTSIKIYGDNVPGNTKDNLCIQAHQLLKQEYPALPHCDIFLYKNIPMGAGLGGGSSDASATLQLLNDIFQLQISPERLAAFAIQLGSDCPYFLHNIPMMAAGHGELLSPIDLNLKEYKILLVNPGIHINTREAFAQLDPNRSMQADIANYIQQPIEDWQGNIVNDFEQPVFALHPELKKIKEQILDHGALYASMSGTGSTVFGIYKNSFDTKNFFPKSYQCHWS